jgi:hypothetical protein
MAALRQALWYWKRIVTKDPKYQGHHQRQEMAAANAGAVKPVVSSESEA